MQEVTRRRAFGLGLRAKVPMITRLVAITLLVSGITIVAISYLKLRGVGKFKAKSEKPELSKDVTGVIEGYEQRVTNKDGRLWLLVKASRDVTYSDGHHELENINMAVYPPEGETPDQISAARAIYQRETNVLYFNGNVKIDTRDKLKVATEALSFDRNSGIAQTDSPVSFERENVSGSSVGAVLEQKSKRLELKKDVQLTVAPNESMKSSSRSRPVSIKAGHGTFDQHSMQLTFTGGATVEQETDVLSGDNLMAFLNQQRRTTEDLLINMLMSRQVNTQQLPSAAEIAKFEASRPGMFAKHEVWTLDTINYPLPKDPAVAAKITAAKSLDEIAQALTAAGIQFTRAPRQFDSAMLPANLYAQLGNLAPGEPFIAPGPGRAVASVITERKAAPFTPEQTRQLALSQMKREKINQLVTQRVKDLKAKAKIEFQPGFGPPKH